MGCFIGTETIYKFSLIVELLFQVLVCQRFQVTVLRVLIDQNLDKLLGVLVALRQRGGGAVFDYLLLPSAGSHQNPSINWNCVSSVQFLCRKNSPVDCISARCHGLLLHTVKGSVCRCVLENCLVVTPHNNHVYCITGVMDNLNGNSTLCLRDGGFITYIAYFKQRYVSLFYYPEILGRSSFTSLSCFPLYVS